MKAVGYIRVSTDEQALGVEAQRKAILDFCNKKGIELTRFFEDIGVSGAIPAFKRPGFSQMIEYCKSSNIKLIIIYSVDRLARSFMDLFETIKKFETNFNIKIISVREEILQTLDPMYRKILLAFLAWAADFERYLIRLRTRQALQAKGVKHSREIPDIKKSIIVNLYRQGYSIRKIAHALEISERQVRKVLYSYGILTLPPDTCPRCFCKMKYDDQFDALYCENCGYLRKINEDESAPKADSPSSSP